MITFQKILGWLFGASVIGFIVSLFAQSDIPGIVFAFAFWTFSFLFAIMAIINKQGNGGEILIVIAVAVLIIIVRGTGRGTQIAIALGALMNIIFVGDGLVDLISNNKSTIWKLTQNKKS